MRQMPLGFTHCPNSSVPKLYVYKVNLFENAFIQRAHHTILQVQALAKKAVSWCKASGGKVGSTDLVRKLSKLATSGKHPQNAERDLQATVQRYGKSMKIHVDSVPVRLYDPATEEITQSSIDVLCPISLAHAIWREGADLFEAIFLGSQGASGAKAFWENAKQNASWFKNSQIPKECYKGLLPLYLYGDDVEAYRNSDPGAVSALGWGCDFGYKNEAMLQNFLLTCYAEYTACEHTHDDLLQHLMKKFQAMGDPSLEHPWHAAGYRFMFAGCRGDLKWINEPCDFFADFPASIVSCMLTLYIKHIVFFASCVPAAMPITSKHKAPETQSQYL